MEPPCCVAHVQGQRCEIWTSTQNPHRVCSKVAAATGLKEADVVLHRLILGGGFGRRLFADYSAEAAKISQAVGRPVKLHWTRTDDLRHDYYRPASYNEMRAGLDAQGMPIYWEHRIAAAGNDTNLITGIDAVPYRLPSKRIRLVREEVAVPTGAWRSVARSLHAFVTECFIDELAHAGGHDPVLLRLDLLGHDERYRRLVETAADAASWGRPQTKGCSQGFALCEHIGSIAALVVELKVEASRPVVRRVVCTADCGVIINPLGLRAQLEGAVAFGLSATLQGEITFEGGKVAQRNFDDYPIVAFDEMPRVDCHLISSTADPTGAGELAVPAVGPAVANAIFAATGRRLRDLPIRAV